jgi:hypothetical protein
MPDPKELIDDLVVRTPGWRGNTIAKIRKIIHDADPEITEEWKWRGAPVWSHNGIVCLVAAFKNKVKLTFYQGAGLSDPDKLFNSELEGNKWRAIDIFEGDKLNESSLKALVRSGVEYNLDKMKPARTRKR